MSERCKRRNGNDLSKWWITKMHNTWVVMPPVITEIPKWHQLTATFTTGAEAHATFARATLEPSRRGDAWPPKMPPA